MDENKRLSIIIEGQNNGVLKTCKKYNISRTIYYRWLKSYKSSGIDGLKNKKREFIPPNKLNPRIEESILNLIKKHPEYGPKPIKYLLDEIGYNISESCVYNVMKRHDITNKTKRKKFSKRNIIRINRYEQFKSDNLIKTSTWLSWVIYYGNLDGIGDLYLYTIFDYRTKIACTRIYNNLDIDKFKDLLEGVAVPVAQSLNIDIDDLIFLDSYSFFKNTYFKNYIKNYFYNNGFNIRVKFLDNIKADDEIYKIKEEYTKKNISFLMPYIKEEVQIEELKIVFQRYLRDYNIKEKMYYEDVDKKLSPIEYHIEVLNGSSLLPLWAYIDRLY